MVLVTLSNLDNSKTRAGRASRLQKLDGDCLELFTFSM